MAGRWWHCRTALLLHLVSRQPDRPRAQAEELSRTSVEDISIEGHDGWVAVGTDPMLGDNLCEIAIGFNDDFIEWSVSFAEKPFPPACDVAKELTRQSIVSAK